MKELHESERRPLTESLLIGNPLIEANKARMLVDYCNQGYNLDTIEGKEARVSTLIMRATLEGESEVKVSGFIATEDIREKLESAGYRVSTKKVENVVYISW